MHIETLSVGPLQVNCYLVKCDKTGEALVIDPGAEADRIVEAIERLDAHVRLIINTHGHFDHTGANRKVMETTGAPLVLHEKDENLLAGAGEHAAVFGLTTDSSPPPERVLRGDEILIVGELEFQVVPVPGHSPGGICLYAAGHLFSGDALFAGSVGRTDLPGGSHDELVRGIREKLFLFPDETVVHPGHGPATTIGREKLTNPFVGAPAERP